MSATLPEQLAGRLRSLLREADHPAGAAGTLQEWRRRRDGLLDRLDPRERLAFNYEEVRELIDFLAEAGPSRASRKSRPEWNNEIEAIVPELLFAANS